MYRTGGQGRVRTGCKRHSWQKYGGRGNRDWHKARGWRVAWVVEGELRRSSFGSSPCGKNVVADPKQTNKTNKLLLLLLAINVITTTRLLLLLSKACTLNPLIPTPPPPPPPLSDSKPTGSSMHVNQSQLLFLVFSHIVQGVKLKSHGK